MRGAIFGRKPDADRNNNKLWSIFQILTSFDVTIKIYAEKGLKELLSDFSKEYGVNVAESL